MPLGQTRLRRGSATPGEPTADRRCLVTARIDAHVHVWTRSTDPQPWIDPATMSAIDRDFTMGDLGGMLDSISMHSAVVVQSTNSAAETLRLLETATDRVAGVVGWLDVTTDVRAQLDALSTVHRSRLVGIRHLAHIDPDADWLGRREVRRGLGALGREGLSFDFVVRWWQLDLVHSVATECPDVTFVLDHLGGPPINSHDLAAWERALRTVAGCPNVSAKLSGVPDGIRRDRSIDDRCRRVVEAALDVFGVERLVFGSDWPLVELAGGSQRWRDAVETLVCELSTDERSAIFGSNAARVYRLAVT